MLGPELGLAGRLGERAGRKGWAKGLGEGAETAVSFWFGELKRRFHTVLTC